MKDPGHGARGVRLAGKLRDLPVRRHFPSRDLLNDPDDLSREIRRVFHTTNPSALKHKAGQLATRL